MSNVTFDEEPEYVRRYPANIVPSGKQGSIIGFMYKLGVAKTEKDANVVLGGIVAVCIIVSATMFVFVQPHQDPAREAAAQRDIDTANAINARAAAQTAQHP